MAESKRNWFTTNIHELVHFTKQNAAKAYERLENHIIDWFLSENNLGGYESAVEAYMRTYSKNNPNFTRADAKDEITADSIAALFSTKDGAKSFVHYIADTYKQKSKEIFDTFEEWINNIITSINTMLKKDVLSPLQRTVLQMDKKQAMSIRKEFLSALDEAIKNYASSKTEQKNNTADSDVKNSKTLGKFADVDVNSDEVLDYFGIKNTANALNDYVSVQRKVIKKLDDGNFFNINNRNIVVNADSNIVVEITRNGIRETFSTGKRYQSIPRKIKIAKIAVVKDLPQLIKYAEVVDLNEKNYHTNNGNSFLTLTHPVVINDSEYSVEIKIKKTSLGNKFYIHNITLQNKNEIVSLNAKDNLSRGLKSYDQSLTQNVSQNNSNVNTKSSKSVDSEGNELSNEQIERYSNIAKDLRDEQGRIKPFYHGTSRGDRVGNYFNPDRATSGPMAYFTDNKEIAENYSRDKSDTSLAYEEEYDSYETQFRVNGKSIVDYWHTLNYAQKKELTEKIKQVTFNDDDEIVLDPNNEYGIGNFNDYELKLHRGNALSVLVDGWLGGGTLWNEESRFLEVLDKIGIKNAEYKDPNFRDEKVYKVYLNVTNPFNTANVDEEFISDLEDYVSSTDMSIYDTENSQADSWDKHGIDIEDWIERLRDDYEQGTTYSWTSIPDVVTDFLKDYGKYDGIVDQGGKRGGNIHTVVIPFYSNQIKNVDNTNPTDSTDIRYSKDLEFKKALTGFEWKKYNESMATEVDEGLRISDNSILVECENDSKYQYKYAIYDDFEDGPQITDVYAIGRIDTDVEDDVPSQCHNIAKFINGVEKQGYDNRKYVRQIYRDFLKNTSYVLARYNMQTSHFYVIGRGSVKNGTNTFDKSERGRSAGNDTRLSRDVNFTQSELESLKDENSTLRSENMYLATINEELKTGFKLTGGRVINPRLAKVVAQRIKETWNTTLSSDDIAERVRQISVRHQNDADFNWNVLLAECKAIAQDVWDNRKNEITAEGKEILAEIRKTKVSLDYIQKSKIANYYGSYDVFRKKNFGNIKIANDGVPLNVKWMEWSEKYPDLFNPETTDLFQHILHLSQNINNR